MYRVRRGGSAASPLHQLARARRIAALRGQARQHWAKVRHFTKLARRFEARAQRLAMMRSVVIQPK